MASSDISRHLDVTRKHYDGVRIQQGRILLESDWNEAARLAKEGHRADLLEVIGAFGVPGDGFRITRVTDKGDGTYDFAIAPGVLFLGGTRHELTRTDERFRDQEDWVHLDLLEDEHPELPTGRERPGRSDLIYLETWEQEVTQVEDAELEERALGGVDTSTRVRRMHRIRVATDTEPSCEAAFDELVDALERGGIHEFDRSSHELRSGARLTVTYDALGTPDDLCRPEEIRGYLGALNQTVRIQAVGGDRFIWGYDNASPLYRVKLDLGDSGDYDVVRFLNTPRDAEAFPLMGQALEILPWGAVLPNGQKVAERSGHLTRIARTYDPDEHTVRLESAVPTEWVDWATAATDLHSDRDAEPVFAFARLWTGANRDRTDGTYAIDTTREIALGETGLFVRFSGEPLPDDHWVVAVRPETPDEVVPWILEDAAPPVGFRRWVAPLATIRWNMGRARSESDVEGTLGRLTHWRIHDCRRRFAPLTELRGCCTFRVGDGERSFGDYDSIQAALDALPDEGGRICVLPGMHDRRFSVTRDDVVIEGCGAESVIVSPEGAEGHREGEPIPPPLVEVTGASNVTFRDLRIEALGLHGIALRGSNTVRLERLELRARGDGTVAPPISPLATILAEDCNDLAIEDCVATMDDVYTPEPVMAIHGTRLAVRRSKLLAGRDDWPAGLPTTHAIGDESPSLAWGGLHVMGDSVDVEIRENEIIGGVGHGITLGSVEWVHESTGERPRRPPRSVPATPEWREGEPPIVGEPPVLEAGFLYYPPGAGAGRYLDICRGPRHTGGRIPTDEGDLVPRPGGGVSDLRVVGNRILYHGASGISAALFWPLEPLQLLTATFAELLEHVDRDGALPELDLIPLFDSLIEDNDIAWNQLLVPEEMDSIGLDAAMGGIALGFALDVAIRENRICANGTHHGGPSVGIGAILASGLRVESNDVRENESVRDGTRYDGLRGGIAVRFAFATAALSPGVTDVEGWERQVSELRLPLFTGAGFTCHGNRVEQPYGRALYCDFALGPVVIHDNAFEAAMVEGWSRRSGRRGLPLLVARRVRLGFQEATQPLKASVVQIASGVWSRTGTYDGSISFRSNRVTHRGAVPDGLACAVLLWNDGDDVAFSGNQCRLVAGSGTREVDPRVLLHCVVKGHTVRAMDNRFAEPRDHVFGSLLAVSTSGRPVGLAVELNHANHCIFSIPPIPETVTRNHILRSGLDCGEAKYDYSPEEIRIL